MAGTLDIVAAANQCKKPAQSEDLSTKFRRAKRGAQRFVVNVIAQQGIHCTSIAYKTFMCNMYENKGPGLQSTVIDPI